jgi:hypothetical protein
MMFPDLLLLILGQSYAGLEYLVKWAVLAVLINSLSDTLWHLNASRGWVQGSWITIPITVVTQVTFGLMVDLSTVRGAIMLGSLPVIPTAVYLLLTGLQHLKRTRELQTIVG